MFRLSHGAFVTFYISAFEILLLTYLLNIKTKTNKRQCPLSSVPGKMRAGYRATFYDIATLLQKHETKVEFAHQSTPSCSGQASHCH